MSTHPHSAIEALANSPEVLKLDGQVLPRPTREEIDELARQYNDASNVCVQADKAFTEIEKKCIALVQAFGVTPPKAESSKRLEGKLAEFTVTTGNSIAIDESRVEDLRQALVANRREDFFGKLFSSETKHQLIKGAEIALRTETMSNRLSEKVLALFGRCFIPKKKNPSLKVKLLTATPKEKKPRAAKTQKVGE